ncbi:MAG: DNA topology modulation protein [Clostridia bacterium]|nr:DNA topology modulation protein [Clostridia bacterium]
MQKILIIGSPGSGKSTFGRRLSKKLNIPLVHLDSLFWKAGWVESEREEFDTLLLSELKKDKWIIDGNYSRTMEMRLKYADTVIFFDYNRFLCLWRVIKRVVTNYGKVRFDMPKGCPERFDWEFLKYVYKFNDKQRADIYKKLSTNPHTRVIIIKNRKDFRRMEKEIYEKSGL